MITIDKTYCNKCSKEIKLDPKDYICKPDCNDECIHNKGAVKFVGHFKGIPVYSDPNVESGKAYLTTEDILKDNNKLITNKEKIADIVKWLYVNDRSYESADEWKTALIKKLEELFT